jgi:hypothetical protein
MEITSFSSRVIAFFAVTVLWRFIVTDIGFESVTFILGVSKH